MKRGVAVDAIDVYSPPHTSERAKHKVVVLAPKLTDYGQKINFHMVPFSQLLEEIVKQVQNYYTMIVMRRIMVRISEHVCKDQSILSMTNGESLGQVASQTMESMNTINEVTNYPILRPLITMDKEEIIKLAHDIDTYEISIRPYEDCCTVFMPKAPKTRPRRDKVNQFEEKFDFTDLINEAINGIEVVQVSDRQALEASFEDLL